VSDTRTSLFLESPVTGFTFHICAWIAVGPVFPVNQRGGEARQVIRIDRPGAIVRSKVLLTESVVDVGPKRCPWQSAGFTVEVISHFAQSTLYPLSVPFPSTGKSLRVQSL
jgi:hypothetical protein